MARAEARGLKRPRAGGGVRFLGMGHRAHHHQLRGLEERCKLPEEGRGSGQAPPANEFSTDTKWHLIVIQ